MVVSKREAARSALIGFLLGTLIVLPLWFSDKLFDVVPYTDVSITVIEEYDDKYIIGGKFVKTSSCKIEGVFVLAGGNGEWRFLKFKPIDGSEEVVDRPAGDNSFLWEVRKVKKFDADVIEIRTSHDCKGTRVDKIMANIPV